MKNYNFIFLMLALLLSNNVQAIVRTLSNTSFTPGQYSTWDAAQAASSPGDTIYVSPSLNGYGNIYVTVNDLKIIGAGFRPYKLNTPFATNGRPWRTIFTGAQTATSQRDQALSGAIR